MPLTEFGGVPRLIISEQLEQLRQRIAAHIMANGQNASGRTIRSLRWEAEEDHGTLFGRFPFGTMETGRKAGKIPYNMTSIIYQWMQDKGVHAQPITYKTDRPHKYSSGQEAADRSMAYCIGRKIAREGTLLHRQGGRADVYSNCIPQTRQAIRERLIALLHDKVKSIKINTTT